MTDNIESFSAMLRQALGTRIDPDADAYLEMVADDAVMEFPHAPSGFPTRLDGRAAIARHLERVGDMIAFDRMSEPTVHPSTDPDVVVIEFDGFGHGAATGEPYDQSYMSVIRTAGGRIVRYRDYWNPLVLLRATRGAAVIDALVATEAGHE